jgi:cobalt-zinc-cadmium resistance protein CzcA
VDEAETGLKSALAVKVFGTDLETLEQKARPSSTCLESVRGIRDVTLVQELGQPSLTVNINRAKIARYGLNVADLNGLIEAAVGGDGRHAGRAGREAVRFGGPPGVAVPGQPGGDRQHPGRHARRPADPAPGIRRHRRANGASFIYREDNSRYIGVQFSVEGRDLAARWRTPGSR